jgi:Zinc-finger double-stranded RNA-binding
MEPGKNHDNRQESEESPVSDDSSTSGNNQQDPQQQVQYNYQSYHLQYPGYQQHPGYYYYQYFYPSPPYNAYNYHYGYQQPSASRCPQPEQFECRVCSKSFKTSTNLRRHLVSKYHMKKMRSINGGSYRSGVTPCISYHLALSSTRLLTDISNAERDLLYKLDDEIDAFLECYKKEEESNEGGVSLSDALPTPPPTPEIDWLNESFGRFNVTDTFDGVVAEPTSNAGPIEDNWEEIDVERVDDEMAIEEEPGMEEVNESQLIFEETSIPEIIIDLDAVFQQNQDEN